jgi:hypothetical protein
MNHDVDNSEEGKCNHEAGQHSVIAQKSCWNIDQVPHTPHSLWVARPQCRDCKGAEKSECLRPLHGYSTARSTRVVEFGAAGADLARLMAEKCLPRHSSWPK